MDGIRDATSREGIGAAKQHRAGASLRIACKHDGNHADGIRNGVHPIRIRDGKETAVIRKA
jgi:hypothetical protein